MSRETLRGRVEALSYVTICWTAGDAKGYTDWLPLAAFRREVSGVEQAHAVRGPKGGIYHARYEAKVHRTRAELDYRAFPEPNERQDMALGVMAIEFSDSTRRLPVRAFWDDELVTPAYATIDLAESLPDPRIGNEHRARQMAEQLARPEQSRFRQALDLAYGYRCCISGCGVPAALQAAHLVSVVEGGPDKASNGLLLRADLHSLLDDRQLAIEPRTGLVHFSREALNWPEYQGWHRRAKLRPPEKGFEDDGASEAGLTMIWAQFRAEHRRHR